MGALDNARLSFFQVLFSLQCDVTGNDVSTMSHVAKIVVANNRWHCQHLLASQVTWRSIYSPHSSHKNQVVSTQKALLHMQFSGFSC